MLRETVSLHRREFLGMTAAGLAGLALGKAARAEDKAMDGGFKLSVQSYTFRKFDLEKTVAKISAMKVPYIEITQIHLAANSSPEKVKAAVKLCKDFNVTPISYGVQGFTKDAGASRKIFDFAKELGIPYISADPTEDSFDSLDKLVEEYKIDIAIHPHGPVGPVAKKGKARWTTAAQVLKAIKDHSPRIGTCLDTGHLIRMALIGEPTEVVENIKIMGARNLGFHMKDHDNKDDHDVVFGDPKGVLDVAAVLKALKEVKFHGYMSIEYEYHPEEPTQDVADCFKYLRTKIHEMA